MTHLPAAHDACPASDGRPADEFVQIETPPAMSLSEALTLWDQEADRGIYDTGRYRMPYFVWGSGPPVVFIHGLADTSRGFIPVMAALRREFTCIGYDQPAGGPDGARIWAYRHRDLVADLMALLDHLRARTTYLFGASFGSTIALAAMHDHPARIVRAVLQGAFAHRDLLARERILCDFARYWPGPLATLPFRRALDHPADREVFQANPEEYWFHRANSDPLPKATVARRGLMVPTVDLRPMLPAIRQPVLLICGDHDRVVTAECERTLMAGLPNVARVELPECGHYPHYTHAPLMAELIRQFLTAPACRVAPT